MLNIYEHYHSHQCSETCEYTLDYSISTALYAAMRRTRFKKHELKKGMTTLINNIIRASFSQHTDNVAKFEKAIATGNYIDAEKAFANLPGATEVAARYTHEFIQIWLACLCESYRTITSTVISYRDMCANDEKAGFGDKYHESTKIELYTYMLRRIARA